MTNLTEQWKKGELEQGYYYTRYTPSVGKPFVEIELKNYLIDLAKVRDAETVEILAPVPSWEQWQSLNELLDSMQDTNKLLAHKLQPFTDPYFKGLSTKDIAELAKKSIRLTTQHLEDNKRIEKLEELLKECKKRFEDYKRVKPCGEYMIYDLEYLASEIDEVLND